jgi:hypothetical protein
MSREAVHDLPNAEERPSSDSGAGARLYRGLQVRHESTWNAEDIVAFNLESYLSLLWETADSIGGQMVRGMFEHISEVADEHGQVIKANGRDVYELLIEATEKMDVQFDEDGNPGERILAINPETYAQVKGDGPTPDQEERMRVVMERKREEWRASRRRRELP